MFYLGKKAFYNNFRNYDVFNENLRLFKRIQDISHGVSF